MTKVMNTLDQDAFVGPSVDDVLDFYTEQVNAAIAANRDDIVRELAIACEAELASMGAVQHAA